MGLLTNLPSLGKARAACLRSLHFALQADLLSDDALAGLGCDPAALSASLSAAATFPCLADELEEQAKALEGDW